MKTIPQPDLTGVEILTPAEMNRIHFGGIHTPLTAEQLKELAESQSENGEIKTAQPKS